MKIGKKRVLFASREKVIACSGQVPVMHVNEGVFMNIINCFGQIASFAGDISLQGLESGNYMRISPSFERYFEKLVLRFASVEFRIISGPRIRKNGESSIGMYREGDLSSLICTATVPISIFGLTNDFVVRESGYTIDEIFKKYRAYQRNQVNNIFCAFTSEFIQELGKLPLLTDNSVKIWLNSPNWRRPGATKKSNCITVPDWYFPLRDAFSGQKVSWEKFFPQHSPEYVLLEVLLRWKKFWETLSACVPQMPNDFFHMETIKKKWLLYKDEVMRLSARIENFDPV